MNIKEEIFYLERKMEFLKQLQYKSEHIFERDDGSFSADIDHNSCNSLSIRTVHNTIGIAPCLKVDGFRVFPCSGIQVVSLDALQNKNPKLYNELLSLIKGL